MATVFERKERFSELKLSGRVFLANKGAVAGLIIFVAFLLVALIVQVAPGLIGVHYPDVDTPQSAFLPPCNDCGVLPVAPSPLHWFGTTNINGMGNIDVLEVILKAIRIDIALSFFVVLLGAGIGSLVGVASGYAGGLVDESIMRVTDIFFTIPFLVLALAVGYVLGRTLVNMSLALVVVWWPLYARYTRSLTLSTKEMTFVEAARAAGSTRSKILVRHVIPNVLPPVFIQISLDVGTVIIIFSSLAFIGFLPSAANIPELGFISGQALNWVSAGAWWTVVFPGIAITIFSLAVNLMGDGLRDVIDPRRRS